MSVERRFATEQQSVPKAGAAVMTKDGEQVGKVSEISGSFFKVDAPMRRDFWLSVEYVGLCDAEAVQLDFEKKELDEHKLTEPGLEPEEDPTREITRESVILTEDEQLEQRARMERELAEQRKDLPIHQSRGDDSGTIGEPVESELARLEKELGVPGRPASSVSSSTGAVVPPQQHIEPEKPEEARQRVADDGVAHADSVTEDVTAAFSSLPEGSMAQPVRDTGAAGRSQRDGIAPHEGDDVTRMPVFLAIAGAGLASLLALRFFRSRRSRRSLASRGRDFVEDVEAAMPTR